MIGLNQIRLFYICLHWFLFVVNVHRLLESRIGLLFFFLFHYIEAFMSLPGKNTMRAWKTNSRFEGEGRGRINSSVFQWLWASAAYSTNWQRLNRGSLVSSYVKNWTIGCTQKTKKSDTIQERKNCYHLGLRWGVIFANVGDLAWGHICGCHFYKYLATGPPSPLGLPSLPPIIMVQSE